jgi:hypothetical protein
MWLTNGGTSNLVAVLCKTDDADPPHKGLTTFLVEKEPGFGQVAPGLTVPGKIDKMGYKGVDTTELVLDGFRVPANRVLGEAEGRGFYQMMDGVEVGRVNVAARGCGVAQRAFELGHRVRPAARRPSASRSPEHQAVQFRLAEMATKVEAAHQMMVMAARKKDSGQRNDVEAGMAKYLASEYCKEVVEDSFRIHGGYGYSKEYEIERLYREAPHAAHRRGHGRHPEDDHRAGDCSRTTSSGSRTGVRFATLCGDSSEAALAPLLARGSDEAVPMARACRRRRRVVGVQLDDKDKTPTAAGSTPPPSTSASSGAQPGTVALRCSVRPVRRLRPAPISVPPVRDRRRAREGWSLRLDVYPITRSERTVTANYRLTAVRGPADRENFYVNQLFSDGNTKSVDNSFWAADGVQVIDGKNAKVHLPASDGNGQCMCPRNLGSVKLQQGHSILFSGVYAAPPPDVTTMDMTVPTFGTVARVPLR